MNSNHNTGNLQVDMDDNMFDSDENSDNELPISSILSVPYSTNTNISHDKQSKTENLTKDYKCDICGQIFSKRSLIINHFITSLCYPSCSFYPKNDGSLYSVYTFSDSSKYYNNNDRICFPEDKSTKNIRNGKLSRTKKNYLYFKRDTINDTNALKNHRLIHTKLSVPNSVTSTTQDSIQSYECSYCSKVFLMRSDIIVHIFSDHKKDYLKRSCDTCSGMYPNEIILRLKKNRFKCNMSKYICHKSFSTLYRLNQHIKWHIGLNKFECQFCSKIFTKYSTYLFHERTHTKETPFRCNFCGKWFPASCNLNIYFTTNGQPFEYDVSQANFDKTDKMSLLQSHQIIHAENKQLKDTHYNNHQPSSLEVQTSRHTSRELYHCKVCGKSFLRLSLLHSHLKTHLDKKIQQNNGASQNVSKLLSSQDHRAFFTDKHFLQCDICQEIFSDRHVYINHRCALCKCKFCPKVLSNNFSLKRHYLNVHKIPKPFECNLCRKSFQETNSLNRHKQCHTQFREKELLDWNNVYNYETKVIENNDYFYSTF